jgi:2-methylaconitate cis-trans-isomerase PrpF
VIDADLVIPGVAGCGAAVRLDFLTPGEASFESLLPTGQATDVIDATGIGLIKVFISEAANLRVFVGAASVGSLGTEHPQALERDRDGLRRVRAIGSTAAVRAGASVDARAALKRVPLSASAHP